MCEFLKYVIYIKFVAYIMIFITRTHSPTNTYKDKVCSAAKPRSKLISKKLNQNRSAFSPFAYQLMAL